MDYIYLTTEEAYLMRLNNFHPGYDCKKNQRFINKDEYERFKKIQRQAPTALQLA